MYKTSLLITIFNEYSGSTIKVGDREMRYSLPIESRLPLNGPSPGKAPPKPQRSLINIEEPVDQSHQMMTIMEDEVLLSS